MATQEEEICKAYIRFAHRNIKVSNIGEINGIVSVENIRFSVYTSYSFFFFFPLIILDFRCRESSGHLSIQQPTNSLKGEPETRLAKGALSHILMPRTTFKRKRSSILRPIQSLISSIFLSFSSSFLLFLSPFFGFLFFILFQILSLLLTHSDIFFFLLFIPTVWHCFL